jgi:hypothetical protein
MSQFTKKSKKGEDSGNSPKSSYGLRSTIYQEFLAERAEILKHKWLESEKAGQDVGFDWALMDWIKNHREKWRNWWRCIPKK